MKIRFTTPTDYTDGTAIAAAALAAATYMIFLDTANPPVKSYKVPAANLSAAIKQVDGSFLVTVDTSNDLGIVLVPKTTYFVAADDSVDGVTFSDETSVLTYTYIPKPNSPGNFSLA